MEPSRAWLSRTASAAFTAMLAAAVGAPLAGAGLCLVDPSETFSTAGLADLLASGRVPALLGRSALLAALASAGACVVGIALGFGAWRSPPALRPYLAWLLVLPLVLPPSVLGVGALWVLGPAGALGMHLPWNLTKGLEGPAALLCVTYAPIVALLVWARLARLAPELLDAARLSAGSWRIACRILVPLCLPSAACGGALAYLLALFNYTVPSLCRQNVLSGELLLRFSVFFDLRSAALVSLVLAAAGVLVLIALRILMARIVVPSPEDHGAPDTKGGAGGAIIVGLFAACAAGVPLWGLATRLPEVGDMPAILAAGAPSFAFTLFVSACGSALALVLGAAWALQIEFGRGLRGGPAELLGVLPWALPAPLLGVGLLHLVNRPGLSVLLDGGYALAWAYGVAGFPYACVLMLVSLRLVPREEREAFMLARRRAPRLLLHVAARRLALPAVCAFVACLCLNLGESDAALLLAPPGSKPLPVKIYTLYHFGAPGDVAVLSYGLAAFAAAAAGAGFFVVRAARRRRAPAVEDGHE